MGAVLGSEKGFSEGLGTDRVDVGAAGESWRLHPPGSKPKEERLQILLA